MFSEARVRKIGSVGLCVAVLLVSSLAALSTPGAALAAAPSAASTLAGAGIGDRGDYTLLSAPLSDRVAVQVNVSTGNLALRSTDLSVRGTGLNYGIVRYYNSLATGAGAFGANGSMSNGADVRLTSGTNGSVVYTAPSGFAVTYTPAGGNAYTPPSAYQKADLVKSGTGWLLTFKQTREQLTFDSLGRLSRDADRNGNSIVYSYNSDGTLRQVTDSQGRAISFGYEDMRLTSTTDPSGRHVLYAYDAQGNLTRATDPTGAVWQFSFWEGNSNLNQIVDPLGNSTTFGYDSSHRVVRATYAAYTSAAAVTTYAYSSSATRVTDPLEHTTVYNSDDSGRVLSVTDPIGNPRKTSYDANGNVTTRTAASAAITNFSYLSGGRLASVQMPSETAGDGTSTPGATTTISYGNTTLPYLPSQVTDPQGGQIRYAYNAAGNQTSAATYNADGTATSTANTTTWKYEGDQSGTTTITCGGKPGALCRSTTPQGGATGYGYDSAGNLTTVSPPAPLGTTKLTYDPLSRIVSSTDGRNITTAYVYDANDRVISTSTAGSSVTYAYDGNGNLTSRTDATGRTTYTYDTTGHLTYKVTPNSWGRAYTYDLAGNLTSSSDSGGPAGKTTYTYNAANEPIKVTEPSGAVTNLTWVAGQQTTTAYPNGVTQTVSYDAAGRAVRTRATSGTKTLLDQTATYQTSAGKDQKLLQSVRDSVAGIATTFGYDGLSRLTNASTTGSNAVDYRYIYDRNGNRTQTAVNGTYSAIDTFNLADQLVKRGSAFFGGYDTSGNATSDGTGQAYGYSTSNQTTTFTPPGAATLTARYADSDQTERVGLAGTASVNGQLGVDQDATGSVTTYFTRQPSGRLISERLPTGTYYYIFDIRGSVAQLTGSDGQTKNTYTYDPYGQLTSPSSAAPIANPWRFNAEYLDVATGLYHLAARYYDPKLGRFTQVDPSGKEANSYVFGKSDPVNNVDPLGTSASGCAGSLFQLVGGGVALVGSVLSVYGTGGLSTPAALTIGGGGLGLIGSGLSSLDEC